MRVIYKMFMLCAGILSGRMQVGFAMRSAKTWVLESPTQQAVMTTGCN